MKKPDLGRYREAVYGCASFITTFGFEESVNRCLSALIQQIGLLEDEVSKKMLKTRMTIPIFGGFFLDVLMADIFERL